MSGYPLIRIDELNPAAPSRSHVLPAMLGGAAAALTVDQILGLATVGDVQGLDDAFGDILAAIELKDDILQPQTAVASAATVDLAAIPSKSIRITGTNQILSFGAASQGLVKFIRFAASLTLTHGNDLLLPNGGANIVTEANDACLAISVVGTNSWVVTHYMRASGNPVRGGNLLRINRITSSTTFTPLASAKRLWVRGVGGGGGGGGVDGQTGAGTMRAVSAAGNGGAWFDFFVEQAELAGSYTVTIGAAGTGGVGGGGGNGGAGGQTSITDGTRTATAAGGSGGAGMVATEGNAAATQGARTNATLTGFVGIASSSDMATQCAIVGGWPASTSKPGGSPFGSGGSHGQPGTAASGYGAGGGSSTASASDTTNYVGGAGSPGYVEIWEFG
ncbi:glycine-rich domain-containing protein [Ferirhizobium litorale]|uniref:glycine-rich domain-containing protein n=1 Tax=Ferirhizobium litorale TaxID=2927786 RepID=UPI002892D129|nr:hypothetical protein [Fererhizobium litorale]